MTRLRLTTRRLASGIVAGFALLATLGAALPAAAHVVHVTTAIDIADIKSPHDFEQALHEAVLTAGKEAIAFEPSIVAVTGARVVGDRVLVSVLFADEAGRAMLEALGEGRAGEDDEESEVHPTRITI
jgi:hypothetical protein